MAVETIKYIFETTIENAMINSKLTQVIEGKQRQVQEWYMDTHNQAVRDSLIKLGWTPPPEKPA